MIETRLKIRPRAQSHKRKADGTNGASALTSAFARPRLRASATFTCVSTLIIKDNIPSAPLQSRRAQNLLFMPILPNGIPIYKAALRHHMKTRRAQLSADERARASQIVCEILGAWLQTRAETRIAVYLATPHELNLDVLADELIGRDKIVCAPRLTAATATMRFARLLDLSAVTRSSYNVREPISDEIVRPEIALVPGLAFDKLGGRLGMGGGYYDRVLGDIPVKIGVCFGGQIVSEPSDASA